MLEVGGGARLSDAPPWESRCFLALLALLRERRLALSPAACLSAFERLHGNSPDRSSLALARQAPAGAICASVLSDFNRLRRHFGSCDRAQPPSCRGLWRSVADAALPPRFRFRFRLSGRTGGSEGLAPPIAGTRMRRGFSSRRRQPQSRYGRTWRIGRPGSKAPPLRRRCQMRLRKEVAASRPIPLALRGFGLRSGGRQPFGLPDFSLSKPAARLDPLFFRLVTGLVLAPKRVRRGWLAGAWPAPRSSVRRRMRSFC